MELVFDLVAEVTQACTVKRGGTLFDMNGGCTVIVDPHPDGRDHLVVALRKLAESIDFVVITHNRATIEVADTIYGVTMTDAAVSRVLSLRRLIAADFRLEREVVPGGVERPDPDLAAHPLPRNLIVIAARPAMRQTSSRPRPSASASWR